MAKSKKGKTTGYFCVSHLMYAEPDFRKLKPASKLLLFHLCKVRNENWERIRGNSDQRFYHNDVVLAKEMGYSRYTFIRARKELTGNPDKDGNPTTRQFIDFWTKGNTSWYRILDDVYATQQGKFITEDNPKHKWTRTKEDCGNGDYPF